jgi:hypothetical protein
VKGCVSPEHYNIIAVKMDVDGSHKVVHTQVGGFNDAGLFLGLMLDACGLKEKGSPSKEDNLAISFPN